MAYNEMSFQNILSDSSSHNCQDIFNHKETSQLPLSVPAGRVMNAPQPRMRPYGRDQPVMRNSVKITSLPIWASKFTTEHQLSIVIRELVIHRRMTGCSTNLRIIITNSIWWIVVMGHEFLIKIHECTTTQCCCFTGSVQVRNHFTKCSCFLKIKFGTLQFIE